MSVFQIWKNINYILLAKTDLYQIHFYINFYCHWNKNYIYRWTFYLWYQLFCIFLLVQFPLFIARVIREKKKKTFILCHVLILKKYISRSMNKFCCSIFSQFKKKMLFATRSVVFALINMFSFSLCILTDYSTIYMMLIFYGLALKLWTGNVIILALCWVFCIFFL
jgi:hypothetical protein